MIRQCNDMQWRKDRVENWNIVDVFVKEGSTQKDQAIKNYTL
jgi:hypothetical protein